MLTHETLHFCERLSISDHHVEGTRDLATVINIAAVGNFVGELLIGLPSGRKSHERGGIHRDSR